MGEHITLTSTGGHRLDAYRAGGGDAKAPGLVVIQEIFGVNPHIRSVADRYAKLGFATVAPALFDRVRPGIELGYEAADVAEGRDLKGKVANAEALADVAAAIALLRKEGRKVGIVGYCWGGSLAWSAATGLDGVSAAVSYYGGQVGETATATPKCPVMFHFGETDASIPMTVVEAVQQAHPELPVFVYAAGHGFSCDARSAYHAASADLALERTVAFLRKNLGA